jgi:NADH:ubiquinone oxidoreductase subunit D
MARSVGIKRDLRLSKLETYANYYYINFRSYIGQHGDCYDRFLIRMNEMCESTNIMNQVINKITKFNSNKFLIKNKNLNEFSNITTILPHSILKYTLPEK